MISPVLSNSPSNLKLVKKRSAGSVVSLPSSGYSYNLSNRHYVSFKADMVEVEHNNGHWYECDMDEVRADAKKHMYEVGDGWKSTLKGQYLAKRQAELRAPGAIACRLLLDVFSFGGAGICINDHNHRLAEVHVQEVSKMIKKFQAEERQKLKVIEDREKELAAKKAALAEQTANAARANKRALKKIEHTGSINEIHNKLKTEFCSKLTVEKTDSGIKIPHGIMLEGAWGKFADDLIKWTADNSDCRFVQVSGKDNDTLQENLWEELQKARKVFKKTKERTLISVESFDRLITKGLNSFENIEALKAEMCRFATEYGSTIIFGAKDAKKLVSEAIQPNRLVRVITRIV